MASRLAAAARDQDRIVLDVPLTKDHLRKIEVKDGDDSEYTIYRMMPLVEHWPAARVPDGPNPRSHDAECLRGSVPKAIRATLVGNPEDFQLANRGGCLLADHVSFRPEEGSVRIVLSDMEIHGLADGATSNKVIATVQEESASNSDNDLASSLSRARFNLEVIVGLTDHDRIMSLVRGRNTSLQVKSWSLATFDHQFDWIMEVIDRAGGQFKGRIGWEENSGKDVTVLDVISCMTLFHPVFDDPKERRRTAPTMAYSAKGTADKRLTNKKLLPGYKNLGRVLEDLLLLHDHVYSKFPDAYARFTKEFHERDPKIGSRRGVEKRRINLPLTQCKADYRIDKGLLFPLLGSLRSLLSFNDGDAKWKTDPFAFFDDHGADLMSVLIEQYELCGRSPSTTGKTSAVYKAVHNEARLLLADSLDS